MQKNLFIIFLRLNKSTNFESFTKAYEESIFMPYKTSYSNILAILFLIFCLLKLNTLLLLAWMVSLQQTKLTKDISKIFIFWEKCEKYFDVSSVAHKMRFIGNMDINHTVCARKYSQDDYHVEESSSVTWNRWVNTIDLCSVHICGQTSFSSCQ